MSEVKGTSTDPDIPGVTGENTNGVGVHGQSQTSTGVSGVSQSGIAVHGITESGPWALRGDAANGTGVHGQSRTRTGVGGISDSGFGIHGLSKNATGVFGGSENADGVFGESQHGRGVVGVGKSATGVEGNSEHGAGVYGSSRTGIGVQGKGPKAGFFDGRIIGTEAIQVLRVEASEKIMVGGVDLIKIIRDLEDFVKAYLPPLAHLKPVRQRGGQGGIFGFDITGSGFRPNASVSINVPNHSPNPNTFSADPTGQISFTVHFGCNVGETLRFTAFASGYPRIEQTSNTVEHTVTGF